MNDLNAMIRLIPAGVGVQRISAYAYAMHAVKKQVFSVKVSL